MTALLNQPAFKAAGGQNLQTYQPALGVSVALQRGYMIWDQAGGGTSIGYTGGVFGDGRDLIRFQFNPSTTSTYYSIANSSVQSTYLYPVPGSTSYTLAPLQQTVSFTLYYDRLMELNYGTGNGNGTGLLNDPGVIGFQADVLQFMQFTGMLYNTSNLSSSAANALLQGAGSTSTLPASALGTGVMMLMPCWLYFSNLTQTPALNSTQANSVEALNAQLKYYGYISDWSVTYTHWTESMVPIRGSIDVNFTMMPMPAATAADYIAVAKDTGNTGFDLTGVYAPTPSGTPNVATGTAALISAPTNVAGR